MKLTLQIQLLPDTTQADALRVTVERFNEAATWLAGVAFEQQCANKIALQKLTYYELRARFGLPADTAIRCIAKSLRRINGTRRSAQLFARMPLCPSPWARISASKDRTG